MYFYLSELFRHETRFVVWLNNYTVYSKNKILKMHGQFRSHLKLDPILELSASALFLDQF